MPQSRSRDHRRHAQSARAFFAAFDGATPSADRWIENPAFGEQDLDEVYDGLGWCEFRERCAAAVGRLAAERSQRDNAIVFTSGGPIMAICQHLLGIPDHRVGALQRQLVNSSVTRLRCRPGEISLATFNQIAHLEIEGDGTLITYR